MKNLTFEGKVVTGEGNGKKYLAIPWVKQQIEEKLGFTPFLGTLNLKLTEESVAKRKLLNKAASATICPQEGYCVGLLYKATICSVECAIVVPKVEGYPENILEVIAAVNLRETLKVKDGDAVSLTINV